MSELELALQKRIQHDYTAEGMEALLLKLDLLHDYAAAGRLADATNLSRADLQGWLREIMFVARETLYELEMHEFVGRLPGPYAKP